MAKQFIATTLMDGYADGPHITEVQTGIANQGLYGPDDYVLDEGKKAEAQILTNNSVRVFDATFVIQGRRDVMAANAYADVTIANGEQGMYRNDIIVRKYEKDEMTEIENTSFDVIKGTPSSGVATDPEIPTGDIRTGATMHNMALYRVKLEGLNIVALEPMFKVLYNMADIKKELELLNGNFEKLVDGNKYSVSAEIDTGEVWHDGRKIYKRTFVTTESIVFETPITIPITGVAMSEFWIDTQNSFISTASVCYPLPMVGYGGDPDEHIYVWLNSSGIRIGSTKGGWGTGWKKTVTIRYTKL